MNLSYLFPNNCQQIQTHTHTPEPITLAGPLKCSVNTTD